MEEYLQGELEKRPDISLLRGAEHGSGILSFLHKSIPPDVLAERLDAVGVAIRSGYHCAPLAHRTLGSIESGSARIGLGAENTLEECENFIKRLDKLLTSSIGY
jgi:selenocysteine lyase/cysteine desulfurase